MLHISKTRVATVMPRPVIMQPSMHEANTPTAAATPTPGMGMRPIITDIAQGTIALSLLIFIAFLMAPIFCPGKEFATPDFQPPLAASAAGLGGPHFGLTFEFPGCFPFFCKLLPRFFLTLLHCII